MEYRTPNQYLVPGAGLFEQPISWLFDEAASRRPDAPPLPVDWFDRVELRLVDLVYDGSFSAVFETALEDWPEPHGEPVKIGARAR